MGTMIQGYGLGENDYRGERFESHPRDLKGNNDLLALTRPDIVREIHGAYLEAGSDIIETNTFSGTSISQADYGLEAIVYDLNVEAARLARAAADECSDRTPDKPRFVAGAIGPTTRTAQPVAGRQRPGVSRRSPSIRCATPTPSRRAGLIDGGVDLLLVETVIDTLER